MFNFVYADDIKTNAIIRYFLHAVLIVSFIALYNYRSILFVNGSFQNPFFLLLYVLTFVSLYIFIWCGFPFETKESLDAVCEDDWIKRVMLYGDYLNFFKEKRIPFYSLVVFPIIFIRVVVIQHILLLLQV